MANISISKPKSPQKTQTQSKESAKISESALDSSLAHLGRNPFGKVGRLIATQNPQEHAQMYKESETSNAEHSKLAQASDWLFVKLPADTFVLVVKTALLMKESLNKTVKRNSSP